MVFADVTTNEPCNREPMKMFGRRKILTDYDVITRENVREAVSKAMVVHEMNAREIRYLFRYYRGDQPILYRLKNIRPDIICNTVINRAMEIVTFKVTYLLREPIVYTSRKEGAEITDDVNKLNDYMYLAGKQATDKELADSFMICGVAYRFVYPESRAGRAPFYVDTLDPERTFVAYRNRPFGNSDPVFAVTYVHRDEGTVYDVYTEKTHYTFTGDPIKPIFEEANAIGMIPIIEYINNEFRLGAFEPVLSLLDGANELESNRIEATGQSVQSLTWIHNADLDDEQKTALQTKPSAFILTKSVNQGDQAKIENIKIDLQQADQQVLANDIYKTILNIVGMPSTGDGNTADSSNNGSTIVRNGWQHAEARAKETALLWEKSDQLFLTAALKICNVLDGFGLKPEEVKGHFPRPNYEDIMAKSTVLTTLLGCDKVDPKYAYRIAGLVPDPEEAYLAGMEWYEKQLERQREEAERLAAASAERAGSNQTATEGGGAA